MKNEKIRDIAAISAGFPLRGAVDALDEGDVRFVQMRNVRPDSGIDWPSVASVELPTKRAPVWLADGDILFAARGSNNYAFAIQDPLQKAVCSPHFFVLRVSKPRMLPPEFLAWQINQKPAQDYFQKTATGSYILNIRRRAVENLEIAIPSLHKQELIVKMHQTAIAEKQVLQALITSRNKQMEAIAADLFRNDGGGQING